MFGFGVRVGEVGVGLWVWVGLGFWSGMGSGFVVRIRWGWGVPSAVGPPACPTDAEDELVEALVGPHALLPAEDHVGGRAARGQGPCGGDDLACPPATCGGGGGGGHQMAEQKGYSRILLNTRYEFQLMVRWMVGLGVPLGGGV